MGSSSYSGAIALVFWSFTVVAASVSSFVKYADIGVYAPASGIANAAGPASRCSAGQCVNACNRLRQQCQGFTFEKTSSYGGSGTCQPLSLINPGDAVPDSTKSGRRLYVRADPCFGDSSCMNYTARIWPYVLFSKSTPCNLLNPQWGGYWTAKRRLDVYTTNRSVCMASPFVWDKDGSASGLEPEQQWELSMWGSGDPDCFGTPPETVPAFIIQQQMKLYDIRPWFAQCPFCRLDV